MNNVTFNLQAMLNTSRGPPPNWRWPSLRAGGMLPTISNTEKSCTAHALDTNFIQYVIKLMDTGRSLLYKAKH